MAAVRARGSYVGVSRSIGPGVSQVELYSIDESGCVFMQVASSIRFPTTRCEEYSAEECLVKLPNCETVESITVFGPQTKVVDLGQLDDLPMLQYLEIYAPYAEINGMDNLRIRAPRLTHFDEDEEVGVFSFFVPQSEGDN